MRRTALTLRGNFDFSDGVGWGLGLAALQAQSVVDCDRAGLGKLASGGLARDLDHGLHLELRWNFSLTRNQITEQVI